jgi:hypothetical protein
MLDVIVQVRTNEKNGGTKSKYFLWEAAGYRIMDHKHNHIIEEL